MSMSVFEMEGMQALAIFVQDVFIVLFLKLVYLPWVYFHTMSYAIQLEAFR